MFNLAPNVTLPLTPDKYDVDNSPEPYPDPLITYGASTPTRIVIQERLDDVGWSSVAITHIKLPPTSEVEGVLYK